MERQRNSFIESVQQTKSPDSLAPYPAQVSSAFLRYLAALLVLGLTLYAHTLRYPFLYDDDAFIVLNESIRSLKNWPTFFTNPGTLASNQELAHDNYRPLVTLSYALNYAVGGLAPIGYRIVNLALHLLNTILVFFLAAEMFRRIFPSGLPRARQWPEFVTAAVFLVHPVQVETVVFVSQRSGLLSLAFCLGAFLVHLRLGRFSVLSLVLFATALFCKEMVIVLPLLILVYELFKQSHRFGALKGGTPLILSSLAKSLPYFAVAGAYFLLRSYMLGRMGQSAYWAGSLYPTMLTMTKGLAYYIKLLFVPYPLSLEYLFPVSRTLADPIVLFSLGVIIACFGAACKLARSRPILSYGILFFFIGLLPVSNLIPIKAVIQERFLYLSMIGFAFIIGDLARTVSLSRLRVLLPVGVLVLSTLTIVRARDWRTAMDLVLATLQTCPQSARMHFGLGRQYAEKGQFEKAAGEFRLALAIDRAYDKANRDLARIALQEGWSEETIERYRNTLQVKVNQREALFNLGTAYFKGGKYREAVEAFEAASKADGKNDHEILSNLAAAYAYSGNMEKAINLCVDILDAYPTSTKTRYNLALYYRALGFLAPAEKQLEAALQQNPEFTVAREELDTIKNELRFGSVQHHPVQTNNPIDSANAARSVSQ